MLVIGNFLRYTCAKKYQNRAWFDKVIAKIKWCSFLTHMVHSLFPVFSAEYSAAANEWFHRCRAHINGHIVLHTNAVCAVFHGAETEKIKWLARPNDNIMVIRATTVPLSLIRFRALVCGMWPITTLCHAVAWTHEYLHSYNAAQSYSSCVAVFVATLRTNRSVGVKGGWEVMRHAQLSSIEFGLCQMH